MPDDREFYERDGIEYARVSTILGKTMPLFHPAKHKALCDWAEREPDSAEILARGQRRGTLIHAQIEHYLLDGRIESGREQPSLEELVYHNVPGYMHYVTPLLEKIKEENGPCSLWPGLQKSSLMLEQELYCGHGFAGKPDKRCWFEGKYTTWDWKSARSILEKGVKKKPRPISRYSEAKVQIGTYSLGHNVELYKKTGDYPPIEQGAICILYDWREPHLHLMSIKELKDSANEFIERFNVYQELEGSIFPRPLNR
jgi:hypothetical protein